jgi:predicted NBD/HSP70 family sugar kinase
VILGSGAGAGVAIAGTAHHGPNNSAGEWGHNPLPRPDITEIPGPPCYCGRNGCLERWVSGLVICARLPSARQHRFGHLRARRPGRDRGPDEAR